MFYLEHCVECGVKLDEGVVGNECVDCYNYAVAKLIGGE